MLYLGVLLGTFIFEFAQVYLMQYTGQLAMFDLRKQLMAHLQGLDLAFYDRNPVGRLVTRVTTDVDVLNDLFASGLVTILGDVLVLGVHHRHHVPAQPWADRLMLAAMPLVILATAIFRRTVTQSYRRIRIAIAKINSYLQEHITGIVVLQLFNREAKSAREFDGVNREHMDAYKDAITGLRLVLSGGGVPLHAGAGRHPDLRRLSHRARRLTLGVVVAFLQYGLRFFRPIQDLSEKYNILQGAMASAERIFKLLDTGRDPAAGSRPAPTPDRAHRVRWRLVRLSGRGLGAARRELHDRARRDHRGGGPYRRGQDHPDQPAAALLRCAARARFAWAASTSANSIRWICGGNSAWCCRTRICLRGRSRTTSGWARSGSRRQTVESAAEQVNLLDFIRGLPDGFEHSIRERGSGLSTGQKQLISFARALAHNPRFLILDEATSSVDTDTEFRVREALAAWWKAARRS
jgi:ATP-binding cassette subfamily B multidrug efflux pump